MLNLNNPGNIETVNFQTWKGEIKPSHHGRFATFQTMVYGYRALFKELFASIKRGQDLASIITEWAPPGPPDYNNTANYINFVSGYTGLPKNTIFTGTTDGRLPRVAEAIALFENGPAASATFAKAAEAWTLLKSESQSPGAPTPPGVQPPVNEPETETGPNKAILAGLLLFGVYTLAKGK